MKTLMLLTCVVVLVLALPARSHAQSLDVSGEWTMAVNTDNGQVAATLVLKQDGEKVTGSIRSEMVEQTLEGTMKEKTLFVDLDLAFCILHNDRCIIDLQLPLFAQALDCPQARRPLGFIFECYCQNM